MERAEFLARGTHHPEGWRWTESLRGVVEEKLTPFERGWVAAEGVAIDESLLQAAMQEMLRP